MKYYIIAGEASGDLHAHNLVKELKKEDSDALLRGIGGGKMAGEGVHLDQNYEDIAYMGFVEVVRHLPTIMKAISTCKKDIEDFSPDALILVDYPGFNLRIAKWAKQNLEIPIYYYISPQVWAWKENRVKDIEAYTDHMYCILPFEKDFYEQRGVSVHYVGHPLLDEIESFLPNTNFFEQNNLLSDKPILALLPGSRKQEIAKKLPVMLRAARNFRDNYQVVIAGAPGIKSDFYQCFLDQDIGSVVFGQTYDLLHHAQRAMVTSGTATLETALFEVPEVVCYISSTISYEIGKRIVNLDYISLVNLIMNRSVVTELIQSECTPEAITKEIAAFDDPIRNGKITMDYRELRTKLLPGASQRTANLIVTNLRQTMS